MTKENLAKAIVITFTTGFFSSKPAYQAISGHLLRLILDPNPNPLCYISQYDIDAYLKNN